MKGGHHNIFTAAITVEISKASSLILLQWRTRDGYYLIRLSLSLYLSAMLSITGGGKPFEAFVEAIQNRALYQNHYLHAI